MGALCVMLAVAAWCPAQAAVQAHHGLVSRLGVSPVHLAPRSNARLSLVEPPLCEDKQEREAEPPSSVHQVQLWQALLALNTATVIWGSQHAVIKEMVELSTPSALNAARFSLAAIAALPWLPGAPWRPRPAVPSTVGRTWTAGIELGAFSFAGFALQAVGLQFTTASRSAFLLYLNVKLVPLLALLVYGRASPPRTWASAFIALCGTTLLSFDGSPPNLGDAWSLAAAFASAGFILRLDEVVLQEHCEVPLDSAELNAATITASAVLCSIWAACDLALSPGGLWGTESVEIASDLVHCWPQLSYLALATTALTQWLQALGQSRISGQDAAIIYALDPVYAAVFSYLLLGESLGKQGLEGASLVLIAVLLSRSEKKLEGGSELPRR